MVCRAGDGVRTRDIQLGKLTLYQLSYARIICSVVSTNDVGLPAYYAANSFVVKYREMKLMLQGFNEKPRRVRRNVDKGSGRSGYKNSLYQSDELIDIERLGDIRPCAKRHGFLFARCIIEPGEKNERYFTHG